MSRNEIPLKVLMIDIPCTEGVVLEKLLTKEKKMERKKIAAIENFGRWEVPFGTVFLQT